MPASTLATRLGELGFSVRAGTGLPRLAPATLQEAADLLGTCSREGWKVRLAGAGTRRPAEGGADLVVSSEALAGLDVHVPDDLTVGVLAGTPHGWLERELAGHGQLLPLDPPALERSSLGGTFAAAFAGPLRAAYGTPRDLALGLHAVTADGRVLRLGGQVVKNVAGYDLVRLLVGSRGTLAFLAQLHVRLRSIPASDTTILAAVRDGAEAAALALELREAAHPVALEVLAPRGAFPWRLALRFHGSRAVTGAAAERVRRSLPAAEEVPAAAAAEFWSELRNVEAAAGTRIRVQGRPAELAGLLAALGRLRNSASDKDSQEWLCVAHGTEGIVRLCHPARAPAATARLAPLLRALVAEVSGHGTCICEVGPEALQEAAPPPEPAAAVARLEAELRRRFDPAAILVGN